MRILLDSQSISEEEKGNAIFYTPTVVQMTDFITHQEPKLYECLDKISGVISAMTLSSKINKNMLIYTTDIKIVFPGKKRTPVKYSDEIVIDTAKNRIHTIKQNTSMVYYVKGDNAKARDCRKTKCTPFQEIKQSSAGISTLNPCDLAIKAGKLLVGQVCAGRYYSPVDFGDRISYIKVLSTRGTGAAKIFTVYSFRKTKVKTTEILANYGADGIERRLIFKDSYGGKTIYNQCTLKK